MFFTKLKEFLFGKPQAPAPVDHKLPEQTVNLTTTDEIKTDEKGHVANMPETSEVQKPAVITKSSSSNKTSDKKPNKTSPKSKTTRKPKANTKPSQ